MLVGALYKWLPRYIPPVAHNDIWPESVSQCHYRLLIPLYCIIKYWPASFCWVHKRGWSDFLWHMLLYSYVGMYKWLLRHSTVLYSDCTHTLWIEVFAFQLSNIKVLLETNHVTSLAIIIILTPEAPTCGNSHYTEIRDNQKFQQKYWRDNVFRRW